MTKPYGSMAPWRESERDEKDCAGGSLFINHTESERSFALAGGHRRIASVTLVETGACKAAIVPMVLRVMGG